MERLTEWVKDCPEPEEIYGVFVKDHDYIAAAHRLAEYEDTGCSTVYGICKRCKESYWGTEV